MDSHRRARVIEVSEDELARRLAGPDAAVEQRESLRVAAELEVDIPLPSWDAARRVYTRNISCGGLMFRIRPPVTLPGSARIVLTLPDGRSITLGSEIRHVARIAATDDVEVGVQFKAVPPDVDRALRAALAAVAD